MADSWAPRASRSTRTARAVEQMNRGSMGGRMREAAPVESPRGGPSEEGGAPPVHVGPNPPPDTPTGRLWFDTDEMV